MVFLREPSDLRVQRDPSRCPSRSLVRVIRRLLLTVAVQKSSEGRAELVAQLAIGQGGDVAVGLDQLERRGEPTRLRVLRQAERAALGRRQRPRAEPQLVVAGRLLERVQL